MNQLKLLLTFVKVVTWICQFLYAEKNWSLTKFQSLLKPLLWTKGVELVKVPNALDFLLVKLYCHNIITLGIAA